MGKIRVLDEQLINQIAAGEVVERPASVVKELAENALDASATAIRVELDEGGLRRILVADDGTGMSREDAEGCLGRHATSKLRDFDGLTRIATMGFRGEAVPAIASVSRFTLTTREPDSDAATRVRVEGGKLLAVEEAGAPRGTSVLVEDLFFNTPARRKFLKRAETEVGHATEMVSRLALARPDVGFTLVVNGRTTLTAPPKQKDMKERIAAVLGKDIHRHLLPVELKLGGVSVTGFVATPDYTLSTARGLYTFVNRRYVRDRGLIAAVQRAFEDVTQQGRQPAAVLFIEVPLEQVDVNVHPQKLEVRFSDGRRVFDAVHGAVAEALRKSTWLFDNAAAAAPTGDPYRSRVSEALAHYSATPHRPFDGPALPPLRRLDPLPESARPFPSIAPIRHETGGTFARLKLLGRTAGVLVCESNERLVLVDPVRAKRAVALFELERLVQEKATRGQPFLFPASVELGLEEARATAIHLEELRRLGLDLEPFGGTTFALKSVPGPLAGCDYRKLLADTGALLASLGERPFDTAEADLLGLFAGHAGRRAQGTQLTDDEARALFEALDASGTPFADVATELSADEIAKRIGR